MFVSVCIFVHSFNVCIHPPWLNSSLSYVVGITCPLKQVTLSRCFSLHCECQSLLYSVKFIFCCKTCITQWKYHCVGSSSYIQCRTAVDTVENSLKSPTQLAQPYWLITAPHTRGYSSCFSKRFHLLNCFHPFLIMLFPIFPHQSVSSTCASPLIPPFFWHQWGCYIRFRVNEMK